MIRTIEFSPLKVKVDSTETPVQELAYKDEDGNSRTVHYVVVNGEKIPIQYRVELIPHLMDKKLDQALVKVESDRIKKAEIK